MTEISQKVTTLGFSISGRSLSTRPVVGWCARNLLVARRVVRALCLNPGVDSVALLKLKFGILTKRIRRWNNGLVILVAGSGSSFNFRH